MAGTGAGLASAERTARYFFYAAKRSEKNMTRPDRSLPRRQAPPLSREANDRTNGRPVSMSRTTLGGRGSPDKKAADDPGSRSGRYRSETSLCAASGSGYRPGPRHLLIPGSGQRSALAVRCGWFPVAGGLRDDRHGFRYRAGREQRSAFWRVFRRRSPVHFWAARSDGGTLSRFLRVFPGAEGIRF